MVVNETERVVLTREISSNPLANVSWYDGQELLKSEIAVSTTIFIIEKTRCTDTKNFTLIASNALQINVTSFAELIVNCKYYKLLFHTKLKYIFKQTFKHIFPQVFYVVNFVFWEKKLRITSQLNILAIRLTYVTWCQTFIVWHGV